MTGNQRCRGVRGLIAVSGAALLLSACGSSSSSSSSSSGSATNLSAASTSHSGTAKTTGTPITVGSALPIHDEVVSETDQYDGLKAAISSINASGGIHGHPLKLDFCDTMYTVSGELSCARQFISDHVSAVVGPDFNADPTARAIIALGRAKIAVIGDEGLFPAELNAPNAFPLASGLPGWMYGAVDNLLQHGARKIALVADTNPAAQYANSQAALALKSAHLKPTDVVTADASSDPTFSSAAAKAQQGGTDGVIVTGSPPSLPKLILALRQGGYKGLISGISSLFPPESIVALKSQASGLLISSQLALISDTGNPGIAAWLAGLKRYEPTAKVDAISLTAWTSVQLFAAVADGLSDYSATTVLNAMNNIETPIPLRVTAPYRTKGVVSPLPEFSRILNPTIVYGVIKHGELVPTGALSAQNPFTSLKSGK